MSRDTVKGQPDGGSTKIQRLGLNVLGRQLLEACNKLFAVIPGCSRCCCEHNCKLLTGLRSSPA